MTETGKKSINIVILLLIILALLGYAYYMYVHKGVSSELPAKETSTTTTKKLSDITGDVVTKSNDKQLPVTYQNKQFGFELDLPEDYTGSSFQESNGVNVLLKNTKNGEGFQIYIAPYGGTQSVTVSEIQSQVPELKIESPQNALIAGGKIQALIFIGESADFGKTREVWFVKDGNLYQVIAPFALEQTIGPVVESLRFTQ